MGGTRLLPDVEDRLDSWKEIASYLNRSVRTVLRWEQEEGLPVHRLVHDKRGSVYAYKSELDTWAGSRGCRPGVPTGFRKLILRAAGFLIAAAVMIVSGVWVWTSGSVPQTRLVALTASSGQEGMPAFSPDGRQIAYAWQPEGEDYASVYVKLVGSGEPLRLTSGKPASHPAWSPDGRYIAYHSSPPGIYLIPALGGAERKLASVGVSSRPSWFPDGKRLAIVDLDPGTGFPSIFELHIDTGARRKLTSGLSKWGDLRPAVSPDGKTLGFWRSPAGGVMAIYLMPFGGGEPRQLTKFEDWAGGLAWTPDGREIVYCASRDGLAALWRIPAAGGAPQAVAAAGHDAGAPALTENRMAFTQSATIVNLWRTALDKPETPRKLAATTRQQRAPQFSPDGKKLAFESSRSGWTEVWTSDSDGGNLVQITSMGASGSFAGTPRWSPDGAEIAFDARPGGNPDIFVVSAQGGAPHRITADPAEDVVPSFSRDGRWIYFASNRSGNFQVWKVPRAGGDAVQVTRQGGFAPMESPDGKYLYYMEHQRGPSGLWRMPTGGGPGALVSGATRRLRNWTTWTVTNQGVVFVDDNSSVKLLDPVTGGVHALMTLPKFPTSFAVSPDGRTIVYSRWDQRTSNIMLLENFR